MSVKQFSTVLLLAALAPAAGNAQQATTTYKATTGTTTNTCTGDKIQLTGFSISPAAPTANQAVTIKVDVKNLCSQALNIPYKIADGSTTLTSGTKSVPANTSASVSYTWTATAGSHSLDALLDSGNSLNETSTVRVNNGASSLITFTVAAPVMETQMLNYEWAQQAGAGYNLVLEAGVGCTNKALQTGGSTASFDAVLQGYPPCGQATYEAFTNFTLKNGWKVKSVEVVPRVQNSGSAWEWVTRPTVGSTTPRAKIRIKNNSGTDPMWLGLWVKIQIEGPKGTTAY